MNKLFDYLFGTFNRFACTMVIAVIIYAQLNPGAIRSMIVETLREFDPLVNPVLRIGIMILGFMFFKRLILPGGK